MDGTSNLEHASVKCMLLMSNTTADTENDKAAVTGAASFTTLDQFVGTGYTAGGVTLTGTSSDAGNYGKFDAANCSWTGIGPSTSGRGIVGALIYLDVSVGVPYVYIDLSNDGVNLIYPAGGNLNIIWSATGIINITGGITSTT
jgi:hypothetical protein